MPNAFDDITPDQAAASSAPAAAVQASANAFDDITPPAPPPPKQRPAATAADRVQAGEAGIWRGTSYLAGMPADAIANAYNLAKAGTGYVAGQAMATPGHDLPLRTPGGLYRYQLPTGETVFSKNPPPAGAAPVHIGAQPNTPQFLQNVGGPSPVGTAIASGLDKFHDLTPTSIDRPDDPASRYISAATSVVPGVLSGGGGVPGAVRGLLTAVPASAAAQYITDKKPFKSETANNATAIAAQLAASLLGPKGRGEPLPENEIQNDVLPAAQEAGYQFPPATTNPTPGNRILETVAGKTAVQQHASLNNQGVTNSLMREDVDLPPSTAAITDDEIETAQRQAAPGYDAVRSAGPIIAPNLKARLQGALTQNAGASRMAASLGDSKLQSTLEELGQNKVFDANDGIDAISMLRDKANEAYRAGNNNVAKAYKQASGAIEDSIEDSLTTWGGQSGADMLDAYRASRQTFAKIHTLQDARNATTGNVVASKLSAALNRNEPLEGNQLLVAQAAGHAPRAFVEPTNSAGVNHLGLWGSLLGGAAAAHEFLPGHVGVAGALGMAAYPLARYGARSYLLGPGQSNVLPTGPAPLPAQALLGAYTGTGGQTQ